ncbi:FAD-dependent oxidoreductase [Streptomyces sp. PSKA54]|uniref:FAD-dependent oxidoreductase n=1 Tax=Streptomyces himalayensis subsp. aureolus TaxID=2758039 RepID=A0A7W2HJG8_9ACTN|nr:FAD-dependent oxidoreductase [Streptomyces himalayensis]MBA4866086.1 FAD-dependent oxidoreductase [Streptomyces himalayensis subsp. aureolus]
MREETVHSDVSVIGGGLAGVCAAIAAARLGRTVALVHNRPVVGGNSSSEVRVWVCGATAHGVHRWARETGIMGELYLENQYRNPDGNPYYWDQVVLDAVRAEPNLRLFLNTDVRDVAAERGKQIESVTGWTMGSEKLITFFSPVFVDCTGDGLIGHLAGADYRIGRESRAEHGEEWAPPEPDGQLLGSTILFYTKDAGHPVKYVPPSFAKNILDTPIPEHRLIRTGDNGCDYWWVEWGGELDTVHDNEHIRDELWSVIHGIWDHIKNSGRFDADTLTLEWVGAIPGKREYRRFLGDHVLTQTEVMSQKPFDDRIAFGGWSVDLHPAEGMYAEKPGARQRYSDGVYHIPFRSLYSRNVRNLLFAGRNISATHIAFGSTRVMATCATIGEAAGTGAALCAAQGVSPRELADRRLPLLQQTLLRQDASLMGVRNTDPDDLARAARVTASSTLTRLTVEPGPGTPTTPWPLDRDLGFILPVDPRLDCVELLVDAHAGTELNIELWDTLRGENAVPAHRLVSSTVPVPKGKDQWVSADLTWQPDEPRNAVVVVRADPHAYLHLVDQRRTGVLCLARKLAGEPGVDHDIPEEDGQPVADWVARGLRRRSFCFRAGPTRAYSPDKAVGGYQRPFGGPQMWHAGRPGEAWLRLDWDTPVEISTVHLVLDDDVDEYLNNLHRHRTEFEVMPELVSDYRVEALTDGGDWTVVAQETGNRHRHRTHRFAPVRTGTLRVVAEATNGAPEARIVALRAYA